MGLKSVSKSSFLDGVAGKSAPRPAADDKQIVVGGDAITDHKARQAVLTETPQPSPFINATPKFSTGPRSTQAPFPGMSATERKAP